MQADLTTGDKKQTNKQITTETNRNISERKAISKNEGYSVGCTLQLPLQRPLNPTHWTETTKLDKI